MGMQFCVMHPACPDDPHRGPWSELDCDLWVQELENDGGKVGSFYVACREVSEWKQRQK